MKRILIVLVTVFLVIGLVACGKSAGEAVAEKILEDMSGGNIDIDIDDGGNSVTIKTEEGEIIVESAEDGMVWPSDKLPAYVPEIKGVKVTLIMNVDKGTMVSFEDCDKNEAEAYIELIKSAGWNIKTEMDLENALVIMADKDEGEMLIFNWHKDENVGDITYSQQ